jgi:uncharacterized RDD family membrane protein YckC
MRAVLVDEVLIALAGALLYGMVLQTGVAAVVALPLSRAVGPLAAALGTGVVPLTVALTPVLCWALVRVVYRVVGTGSPSGQTPGKRAAGLRVERATDGQPPGYRSAFVRELVLLLEVATVVGLVGALARPPWHDVAARTRLAAAPPPAG